MQQEFLYTKVLQQVSRAYPVYSHAQIVDETVQRLYQNFIPKQDRHLIRLSFKADLTQNDLDIFLKHWDIEAAGSKGAAIAAYFMKMHPTLKFDAYTGPRLKGLLNYLRFQNLELIGHFSKIVRHLNQKGIVPMIIKGGAMRYLRPDLPRVMGDIDILLHSPKDLKIAKKLVQEMGYIFTDADHSVDVHPKDNPQKGILDIHQFFGFLSQFNNAINHELFKRAEKKRIFSVDVLLPIPEDMVFICLNNLTLNLKHSACVQGLPQAIFDLTYLIGLKKDFDWDIVMRDILITHTQAPCYLAMRFINQVVPDLFPKSLLSDKKLRQDLENFIDHDKFYSLYVHDVKFACKKLKLFQAIRHWSTFKNYIRSEGQHFFTKRILKHPLLIRLFLKCFYG